MAYYTAINAHDYAKAWALSGGRLSSSYSAFVRGFANTAHDTVVITGTSGPEVRVRLTAVQKDGSRQHFAGTYSVSGGHITAAHLRPTS